MNSTQYPGTLMQNEVHSDHTLSFFFFAKSDCCNQEERSCGLHWKIEGKVVADKKYSLNLCKFCVNIVNLSREAFKHSENVKSLVDANKRHTSKTGCGNNVNNNFNRVVSLGKQISKAEHYGCWNSIERFGISNEIPDWDLEEKL